MWHRFWEQPIIFILGSTFARSSKQWSVLAYLIKNIMAARGYSGGFTAKVLTSLFSPNALPLIGWSRIS